MSSILAQIEMGMPNVLPGTDVHLFFLWDTSTQQCINLPQSGDVWEAIFINCNGRVEAYICPVSNF